MSKVKKVLAMILSMAMILGMSLTTFAAIDGANLTVKGLATNASQEVKIYEIYRLDENNNLWEKSDWAEKVEALEDESSLNDSDVLEALKSAVTGVTPDGTKQTFDEDQNGVFDGSVTFNNLQAGAYLVLVTDSSNKTEYSTMVAVTYKYNSDNILVANTNTEVVAKAEDYNITKEASDNDGESSDQAVEVGDLVTYTIKTVVPYVAKGETTTFTITDALVGATYYLDNGANQPVKGVKPVSTVTVGGQEIFGIEIPNNANGAKTFTIDLSTLVSDENIYAGQEVVITYTAKVEAFDEITNTANSSHVSDPVNNTTKTFTGQLEITKLGEEENGERPTLEGATFAVYKKVTENSVEKKYYAKIDTNGYVTGEWIPEVEDGVVPEGAGTITTDAQGVAVVKGLDAGTYWFKETVAPDGYSINAEDVSGTISEQKTDNVVTGYYGETSMNDSKLGALPSTGGIGTTIFTIAGCAIMIAAAGLYFASRRKENK